jgi:hypothetical protein
MTTFPNPPTTNGRNDGGPGTRVQGRLSDIARSVPNPAMDITLPSLPLHAWNQLGENRERIQVLISWQSLQDSRLAAPLNGNPRVSARQQAPTQRTLAAVAAVFGGLAENARVDDVVRQSGDLVRGLSGLRERIRTRTVLDRGVEIFLTLANHFQAEGQRLNRGIDLRAPWFGIRDQLDGAGCVGFAVADLLRRHRDMRLDIPSARFIWQAAKEMDGEERPTTMIAGAGTSLRAALHVARRHGFALESEVASKTNEPYPGSIEEFYRTIRGRRILDFVNLGSDAKLRLAWLSLGRPIACSLIAGRNFLSAAGPDAQIAADDVGGPDAFSHAVLILGYRVGRRREDGTWAEPARSLAELAEAGEREFANRLTDDPAPRNHDDFPVQYLIRNSGGPDWGDRGYAWMNHHDLLRQAGQCYGIVNDDPDLQRLTGNPAAAPAAGRPPAAAPPAARRTGAGNWSGRCR